MRHINWDIVLESENLKEHNSNNKFIYSSNLCMFG